MGGSWVFARQIKKKTRRWKQGGGVTISVGPSAEAFYGSQFVELGTVKQAANSWLEPAFSANKAQVMDRFKARLREKIKAASK